MEINNKETYILDNNLRQVFKCVVNNSALIKSTFSPEDMSNLSKVNKFFAQTVGGIIINSKKSINDYWYEQYKKLNYPLHRFNENLLIREYLELISQTNWKDEFYKQKKRECTEKQFYQIINELFNNKTLKKNIHGFISILKICEKTKILENFTRDILEKKWNNSLISIENGKLKLESVKFTQFTKKEKKTIIKEHLLTSLFGKINFNYEFQLALNFLKKTEPTKCKIARCWVDIKQNFQLLDSLLEENCSTAMVLQLRNFLSDKNYTGALKFMERYHELDKTGFLSCKLGTFYSLPNSHENVVERDFEKAIKLFQKAESKGYLYAEYWLGMCYLRGEGVNKDENKALELLKSIADKGCCQSLEILLHLFKHGAGPIEVDIHKASACLDIAAQSSHPNFLFLHGELIKSMIAQEKSAHQQINQNKIEEISKKMLWLYTEAAKKNHSLALHRLGSIYEVQAKNEGEQSANHNKAIYYYLLSAIINHNKISLLKGSELYIKTFDFNRFKNNQIIFKFHFEQKINIPAIFAIAEEKSFNINLYNEFLSLQDHQNLKIFLKFVEIFIEHEISQPIHARSPKITTKVLGRLQEALQNEKNAKSFGLCHFYLGLFHYEGIGTENNIEAAKVHLNKAIELGFEKGKDLLAKILKKRKR